MSTIIRITARPAAGFRRGGIRHPAQPVEHPSDRFSEEVLARLKAEPNLLVEVITSEGEASRQIGPDGAVVGGAGSAKTKATAAKTKPDAVPQEAG